MKQVNLSNIFDLHLLALETLDEHSRDLVIGAMKEACNQTVDLCAENAKIGVRSNYGRYENSSPSSDDNYEVKEFIGKNTPGHGDCTYEVIYPDLQSILNTKKQII